MNPEALIHRYYAEQPRLEAILLNHSRQVADKSLCISAAHPELHLDEPFLYEAAMLHDIGILLTDAPGIQCFGSEPYIRHGLLGAELLRKEGLPRHARVAERHTGAGITIRQIKDQNLPLPLQDFSPETLEEQVVCYADKFFSKSRMDVEKSYEKALHSLERFGADGVARFQAWHAKFGDYPVGTAAKAVRKADF